MADTLTADWAPPRVLLLGDVHSDWEWLADVALPYAVDRDARTIVQLGDFGLGWRWSEYDATLRRLDADLERHGCRLLFLPGNHENHDRLANVAAVAPRTPEGHYALSARVRYTGRVARWQWGDVVLGAVGGGVSVDRHRRVPGVSWWPSETLSPRELRAAASLPPVHVLLTHDGPPGVPMRLRPDLESTAYRQALGEIARSLRPVRWWHGHYHRYLLYRYPLDRNASAEVIGLDSNPERDDAGRELTDRGRAMLDHPEFSADVLDLDLGKVLP